VFNVPINTSNQIKSIYFRNGRLENRNTG